METLIAQNLCNFARTAAHFGKKLALSRRAVILSVSVGSNNGNAYAQGSLERTGRRAGRYA